MGWAVLFRRRLVGRDNAHESSTIITPDRQNPPSPATLLSLPPEIRNQIWGLLILQDATIVVSSADSTDVQPLRALPAITQVRQQIRAEALPIFLGRNSFKFDARWIVRHNSNFETRCFEPLLYHFESTHDMSFTVRGGPIPFRGAAAKIRLTRESGRTKPNVTVDDVAHRSVIGVVPQHSIPRAMSRSN